MQFISLEPECDEQNDRNSTRGYIEDVEKIQRWLIIIIYKNRETFSGLPINIVSKKGLVCLQELNRSRYSVRHYVQTVQSILYTTKIESRQE